MSRSQANPQAIVPAQSAEEREYDRCLAEVETAKRRAAELQAEIEALTVALARFEAACQARVGDLLTELRRVGRAVADYEQRLARLDDEDETDPDAFAADEEEPAPFAWHDDEPVAGTAGAGWRARAERPEPPRLPKEQAAAVKRLYRDLAKRCHPDYARSDGERERRVALMQRINEAFRDRDLELLRTIHQESETEDPAFPTRPLRERLAWVWAELARVNALLGALKAEFSVLRGSEVHRLWRRYEAGEPVLDALEDDLEKRVAAQGRRLDRLIAAYRRALDERQMPTTVAS